jgi:diguanylate cyclase
MPACAGSRPRANALERGRHHPTLPPVPSISRTSIDPTGAQAYGQEAHRSIRRGIVMVAASYGFDSLLLAGYAVLGHVSWALLACYAAAGAGQCLAFDRLVGSGWSRRFRDPSLSRAHMAVGCSVQLLFIALAPQVFNVFAFATFTLVAFGTLQLTIRANMVAWLLLALGVGVVFIAGPARFDVPTVTTPERALLVASWGLALVRCSVIGSFGLALREMVQRRQRQLEKDAKQLTDIAHRDPLTGVLNRRGILSAVKAAEASGRSSAVALLDLDHFKSVNDRHGHQTGDEVLRLAAKAIGSALRVGDAMGRYGGEEFLVLLDGLADAEAAVRASERVRSAVAEQAWAQIAAGLEQTVSIGVVVWQPGELLDAAIARADAAMYEAKRSGRNAIRVG